MITVNVYSPLISGGNYVATIANKLSSYTHSIRRVGGYYTASFSIQAPIDELEDWIERGLGRHIVCYGDNGAECWEGIVDKLSLEFGGLSLTRGPLSSIGNRVLATYAPVDATVYPPTTGARTDTVFVQDAASIAKYGAVERVVAAGNTTVLQAEQLRDTYLYEHIEPSTSMQLSVESGKSPSLVVDCIGYCQWLSTYMYNQTASSGFTTVHDKMVDVLEYNPNTHLMNSDYSLLSDNALLVMAYESDYADALTVITELVDLGDAFYNLYSFGLYDNRQAVYQPISTTPAMLYRLRDPFQRLTAMNGANIDPCAVRPGAWILFSDLMIGRTVPLDPRRDPRMMLVDTVDYTAPNGLRLNSKEVSMFDEQLKQLGLGL